MMSREIKSPGGSEDFSHRGGDDSVGPRTRADWQQGNPILSGNGLVFSKAWFPAESERSPSPESRAGYREEMRPSQPIPIPLSMI